MYKVFVHVTPESGGAGTTPIAVAADENEGAARSTSLNIAGGGVTRTVSITKRKCLWKTKLKLNIG
jgi:hypothetical protein